MRSLVVVVLLAWLSYLVFFMSALVPVPRSVHAVVFSGLVLALLFVWIGVAEGVRRPITKTILWIRDLLAGSTRQLR